VNGANNNSRQTGSDLLTKLALTSRLENPSDVEVAMPLKLSLKPGEKFVLNGAVLSNGDKRASLVVQNKACVLREKDIMQPEEANTPARRVYFPIMMMYLDEETAGTYYSQFALRMTEFMNAIKDRQALAACVDISKDVMMGAYYKALVKCKTLFDFEQERLNHGLDGVSKSAARR
jgi:flagellar biosynthesis repressor protein FlbT